MKKFAVKVPKQKIVKFCKRNHIQRLSFFGSILRADFSQKSDLDLLVEFEPDNIPGFFDLIRMEEELYSIFGGRKVDLRTPADLSRYFRDDVLAEAGGCPLKADLVRVHHIVSTAERPIPAPNPLS